jgi:hypothetical protein
MREMQFGPFPFPPWPREGESASLASRRRALARYQGGAICELLFILLVEHLGVSEARRLMERRIGSPSRNSSAHPSLRATIFRCKLMRLPWQR